MCVTNHQSLDGRKKQLASVFCFAESSVYMIGVSITEIIKVYYPKSDWIRIICVSKYYRRCFVKKINKYGIFFAFLVRVGA